ncbi:MAG: hypothetical protein ACLQDQ_15745 [Myxococcaceae bacterium]
MWVSFRSALKCDSKTHHAAERTLPYGRGGGGHHHGGQGGGETREVRIGEALALSVERAEKR